MDIRNLKGSIVALVTPFNADGSVNFDKLRNWWSGISRTRPTPS